MVILFSIKAKFLILETSYFLGMLVPYEFKIYNNWRLIKFNLILHG